MQIYIYVFPQKNKICKLKYNSYIWKFEHFMYVTLVTPFINVI